MQENTKGIKRAITIIGFIILIGIIIALITKINITDSNCAQNTDKTEICDNQNIVSEKEYKGERYVTLDEFNNISTEDNVKYIIKDFYIDNKKVDIEIDYYNNNLKINGNNIFPSKAISYSPMITYEIREYFNKILFIKWNSSGLSELMVYDFDGSTLFSLTQEYYSDGIYLMDEYTDGEVLELHKILGARDLEIQDQLLVSSLYPYCSDDKYNMANIEYNLIYNSEEEEYGFWELKIVDIKCTYRSDSN